MCIYNRQKILISYSFTSICYSRRLNIQYLFIAKDRYLFDKAIFSNFVENIYNWHHADENSNRIHFETIQANQNTSLHISEYAIKQNVKIAQFCLSHTK